MEQTTQSSTKRHKVSDEDQNTPSIDRLSTLPDGIICNILSFLPTKLSVSTSILARRWRFLWAHVPTLQFEGNIVSEVIHRIMLLHKVKNMNTFRLSRTYNCSEYQLETLITTAIDRNVQNLDLSIATMLPLCLFTCKTVVELRLHFRAFRTLPLSIGDISLPSLKKLYLYAADYEIDEPLSQLLSGCPVLEDLIIMKGMSDRYVSCFDISTPTLKRLTLDFPLSNFSFHTIDYKVVINAPALRYLKVIDCSYEHILISPMASLIEADICLNTDSVQPNYWYSFSMRKLFNCLRNVKCLKLSGRYTEDELLSLEDIDVRFDNLTKLELAADWRFLTKFLEIADNLEVLIIQKIPEYWKNWTELKEEQRACLSNSLKIVTIYQFYCTDQEFGMVRDILRNAEVLKRMEIYYGSSGLSLEAKFDALKKVSLFHRGSKDCEVAFS